MGIQKSQFVAWVITERFVTEKINYPRADQRSAFPETEEPTFRIDIRGTRLRMVLAGLKTRDYIVMPIT